MQKWNQQWIDTEPLCLDGRHFLPIDTYWANRGSNGYFLDFSRGQQALPDKALHADKLLPTFATFRHFRDKNGSNRHNNSPFEPFLALKRLNVPGRPQLVSRILKITRTMPGMSGVSLLVNTKIGKTFKIHQLFCQFISGILEKSTGRTIAINNKVIGLTQLSKMHIQ